jgi:hypothetical protein
MQRYVSIVVVHVILRYRNPETGHARIGFAFTPRTWSGEPVNAEPGKHSELVWAAPPACRRTPSATPPP